MKFFDAIKMSAVFITEIPFIRPTLESEIQKSRETKVDVFFAS